MRARLIAAALGLGTAAAIAAAAPASASADPSSDVSDRAEAAGPTRPAVNRAARVTPAVTPPLTVTRSGQSPFKLSSSNTTAAQLSGIAYDGGTTYYSVGDNGDRTIWQLYTSLNTSTGRIRSSLVTSGISAPAMGSDSEGIALRPGRSTVWVSDETTSSISEFSLSTGAKVGEVDVPDIYRPANVQDNRGLESLTYGAETLWTANEEALKPDGSLSTTSAGSWVRIQQFTGPELSPAGQFGYLTDPISRMSPFVTVERSGLVELLVLPGGALLALERELGGIIPRFRSRVYLLDLTGATDVSTWASLADGGFTPVGKTLLWQGVFGFSNFEAMTLGPQLTNGSQSLLLISDDGAGELAQRQDAFSLIITGLTTAL